MEVNIKVKRLIRLDRVTENMENNMIFLFGKRDARVTAGDVHSQEEEKGGRRLSLFLYENQTTTKRRRSLERGLLNMAKRVAGPRHSTENRAYPIKCP